MLGKVTTRLGEVTIVDMVDTCLGVKASFVEVVDIIVESRDPDAVGDRGALAFAGKRESSADDR